MRLPHTMPGRAARRGGSPSADRWIWKTGLKASRFLKPAATFRVFFATRQITEGCTRNNPWSPAYFRETTRCTKQRNPRDFPFGLLTPLCLAFVLCACVSRLHFRLARLVDKLKRIEGQRPPLRPR